MHLVIINCSPRIKEKSNTNLIVTAFAAGFAQQGNTVEIHHLSQQNKWPEIREAFYQNEHILMALPLYVECIPGIMLEFLQDMPPKPPAAERAQTKLSFLLQGGFAEASQLRCGERYLEMLPGYLNCQYGGTLIKGNMFITHMLPPGAAEKTVAPFGEMAKKYALTGYFSKEEASQFAGPEYFSKGAIALSTLFGPVKKLFFNYYFGKQGCRGKLADKPYADQLKGK